MGNELITEHDERIRSYFQALERLSKTLETLFSRCMKPVTEDLTPMLNVLRLPTDCHQTLTRSCFMHRIRISIEFSDCTCLLRRECVQVPD